MLLNLNWLVPKNIFSIPWGRGGFLGLEFRMLEGVMVSTALKSNSSNSPKLYS